MSYDEKALAQRPAGPGPEPWDTARHGSPDPSWPAEAQLRWFSRYSHVLLLNCSEQVRRSAAAEADREAAPIADAGIARAAGVLHSEHHPGAIVPDLDSCPEHDRADYEARIRRMRARQG